MKVKLIHCGNINMVDDCDRAQKNIFYMPMGLLALCSELNLNGFDAEIIHSDLIKKPLDQIIDMDDVDMIALDCHWINQGYHVLCVAEYIKNFNPNIFVALGGYSASLFAEEIIAKYPFIDAVMRGDGEVPIVGLCKQLEIDKRDLSSVQNLVWRDNSSVIKNQFSYLGTDEIISKLNFTELSLV